MIKIFRRFYAKLSALFLLLLLILGIIQIMVTLDSYRDFVKESDQRLNYHLARDLAEQFRPFLTDSLNYGAIEHTIHDLMVMNPHVEIYLLDQQGNLLAYFAEPEKIKRMAVDITPVGAYLDEERQARLPIYGDDPRSVDRVKTFSVAPIMIGGQKPGYLYVILGGEQYDSACAMIRESYITQTSAISLVITFLFTGVVGLILFFLLTKRFRDMTAVVREFKQGNFRQRITVQSNDEIGQLGTAFNQMADTIVANMDELKQTDLLRRELIANVSHDLRGPLASMQGYLETILIKESTLSSEERRRYLETVFKNVRLLSKLVDELFELSKLEARQTRPTFEPFSMEELAQDVVLKYQPQVEKQRVSLQLSPPKHLPMVLGDIAMIERVLCNLIENALHFTPEHGEITIALHQKNGRLFVSVSDTGCGIPTDDLPHVFDRFYRVEKHGGVSAGTGLGLAISKKILETHDSNITVESTVDVGTTFSFDLMTDRIAVNT